MPLDVKIITPENIIIRYQLAGLASRGIAFLYDFLIQIVLFIVFDFLFKAMFHEIVPFMKHEGVLAGVLIAINFIILWGYHIFFEVLHDGQTPGKKYMGIRVVTIDGHRVDFFPSAARNLLRVADLFPPFFIGGILSMFLSEHHQRIGDLVSGTIVIRTIKKPQQDAVRPPFNTGQR